MIRAFVWDSEEDGLRLAAPCGEGFDRPPLVGPEDVLAAGDLDQLLVRVLVIDEVAGTTRSSTFTTGS